MSTKHIPAPWIVRDLPETDDEGYVIVIESSDHQRIANVLVEIEPNEQDWADARLIAAAPDMLEALKAWRTRRNGNLSASIRIAQRAAAARLADAAIAKAEG